MKLGLGLDVRKASAPAFKGLLDKFTGAVAAYSTRKLTASQPNTLPADYGDGAAAAYSLRKVKASYSGNCIDVRRSSDNTTSSIGFSGNELDTTALEAFVNEEITDDINTTTDSNADGLADGLFSTGSATTSIVTGNGHIGSAQRVDFNTSGGTLQTFAITTLPPIIGQEITISFLYRSNITIESIGNAYSGGGAAFTSIPANTGDAIRFEAKAVWSPTGGNDGRIQPMWLRNSGEFIEISDWSVTYHTADGFVTKWYDQSGTNHAEQSTDNDQPQIVDAGSTILENGKPAIQFDGVDDSLDIGQSIDLYSLASEWSIFMDAKIQDYTLQSFQRVLQNDSSVSSPDVPFSIQFRDTGVVYLANNGSVDSTTITSATQRNLVSFIKRSSDTIYSINGTSATGTKGSVDFTTGLENTTIGNSPNGTTRPAKLKTAELIIYTSDQSDNRQDIEWNINNHYNIYTDSWDKQSAMEVRRAIDNETTNIGFVGKDLDTTALETFASESSPVLDDYTGAAAAYSLRKVRSAYTGSAVRVRRSSDDGLQDIGFDANGDLDSTALTTFVNEDVNTYSSDFSSGIDGLIESRVTASSVDGISDGTTSKDDVLQSVLTSGSNTHYIYKNGTFDLSNTYDVSFEYYIPSVRPDGVTPQTIDGIVVRTGTGSDGAYPFSVLDSWESETIQNWSPSTSNLLLFAAAVGEFIGSIDADGDVYYLKNIVVTQTTADGAVTTWYDQTVPTEKYVSDFSGGVDLFSTLNSPSDAVTRLASVTDDYETTVENVLQYEVVTAQLGMEQKLRKNLGLTVGGTYKVSFKMLIDSGNSPDGLVRAGLYDGAGSTPEDIPFGGKLTETGRWTTFTDVPVTQGNARLFFAGLDSSDSLSFDSVEGDKFYIADVSVDEVNDATQTTDNDQPLVVSGGTLVTENSKAALDFDGVDDYLDTPNFSSPIAQPTTFFVVEEVDTSTSITITSNDSSARHQIYHSAANYSKLFAGVDLQTGQVPSQTQAVTTAIFNGANSTAIVNGQVFSNGNAGNYDISNIRIGSSNASKLGGIQEVIFFDSDQSANRTGIEGNIGRYYNIDGFRDVFVSKWYDQSGNFNHAENSTDTEQPQIVDGGSVITEGTTPKAAIDFDGVDDEFAISVGITSGFGIFGVYKNTKANSYLIGNSPELGRRSTNEYRFRDGVGFSAGANGGTHSDNQVLIAGLEDGANARVYANGVEQAFRASTFASSTLTQIGKNFPNGTLQEMIIFDSDQSSNRTDIENNINKHFKIYE